MELTLDVVSDCVKMMYGDSNVGAIVIPEKSSANTFWEKVKSFERSFYNAYGDEVTDAARYFRKSVFKRVGGYDEKITGPEDWDLPDSVKKAGYKIGRIKSKIIHHERIPSLWSLIKKKYYYGLKSSKYIEKQKIALFSPKTVYFLRPVFYKNWKKLFSNPVLTFSMFVMFSFELLGGGLGYFVGKNIKK